LQAFRCQDLFAKMGCSGGKASSPAAPATATLLDPAAQKPGVSEGTESFAIVIDDLGGSCDCLVPSENGEMLRIQKVRGGPFGLWNNLNLLDTHMTPGRTDEVRKGDYVVRVRKAGSKKGSTDAQWVVGNAQQILDSLAGNGPFEIEVKRALPEEPKEEAHVRFCRSTRQEQAPVEMPLAEKAEVNWRCTNFGVVPVDDLSVEEPEQEVQDGILTEATLIPSGLGPHYRSESLIEALDDVNKGKCTWSCM